MATGNYVTLGRLSAVSGVAYPALVEAVKLASVAPAVTLNGTSYYREDDTRAVLEKAAAIRAGTVDDQGSKHSDTLNPRKEPYDVHS